jgi:mono/diheme cytochrome c family protein
MNRRRTIALMPGVLAGLLVAAAATTVLGQSPVRTGQGGAGLYKTYCASCHGSSARGDGPVASFLRVPPANLAQIAKRNKGTFPADTVHRIIDGRQIVKPHGESQMPVWGDAFSKSMTGGDDKVVEEKIRALVDYLESIQERPAN